MAGVSGTVWQSTVQFFCSEKKIVQFYFSEIISFQCDVIESITNHFTCMKIGHVKIVNEQTFEIAKYVIIYAYDLCTTLGSSEWVQSLFKVVIVKSKFSLFLFSQCKD